MEDEDTEPESVGANIVESFSDESISSDTDQEVEVSITDALPVRDRSQVTKEISNLNDKDKDPYSEDEAELRFLHSKPTCFMLIGQPGVGKSRLGRKCAQEWKCHLINSTKLLLDHTDQGSQTGQMCEEFFLRGEVLPENVVMQIILDKMESPEVQHTGYILDDFPCLSEETLSVKHQFDLVWNWKLTPDFIIHIKIPESDLRQRRTHQKLDPQDGVLYSKDVYNADKSKPTVQETSDEDDEEDESGEEEALPEVESNKIPSEVLKRLIHRPEDVPQNVDEDLQKFKDRVAPLIEDMVKKYGRQKVIELDGNQPADALFAQLQQKLSCLVLPSVVIPTSLIDEEDEEEVPEDLSADEMMRVLARKGMVAPRYRWRRSRWLNYCPVALHNGLRVPGKVEFAVRFLDKMYCLSSSEAMKIFVKNPRPFLLPPQPRPPCSMAIIGPPLSGKTTLSYLLADKYDAKVIDIKKLTEPRINEERKKLVDTTRSETTKRTIESVKFKLKQQAEAERVAREAKRQAEEAALATATAAAGETAAATVIIEQEESSGQPDRTDMVQEMVPIEKSDENSKEAKEDFSSLVQEKPKEEQGEKDRPSVNEDEGSEKTDKKQDETSVKEDEIEKKDMKLKAKGEESNAESAERLDRTADASVDDLKPRVDETHPDVVSAVEEAVAQAEKQPILLPDDVVFKIVKKAIFKVLKKRQQEYPDVPDNGGWILDNFPSTNALWQVFVENDLVPDNVIILRDDSDDGMYMTERYFLLNKEKILADRSQRLRLEKAEKKRQAAELLRKKREEKRRIAEAESEEERLKQAEVELEAQGVAQGQVEVLEEQEQEEKALLDEREQEEQPLLDEREQEEQPLLDEREQEEKPLLDEREQEENPLLDEREELKEAAETEDNAEEVIVPTEDPVVSLNVAETVAGEEVEESVSLSVTSDVSSKVTDEDKSVTEEARKEDEQDTEGEQYPKIKTKIPEGPEMDPYYDSVKNYHQGLADSTSVMDIMSVEPIVLDVQFKTAEALFEEAVLNIEKPFTYQAWKNSPNDVDEDEEDWEVEASALEEEEDEEEEGELREDNSAYGRKRLLGESSFYCPVALKEANVLYPGDPENAVRYREKLYYMSSDDAREQFLDDPLLYISTDKQLKPPPIRLLILGTRGSGKTQYGRHLAKQLGIFHIAFKERLQELIIAKTKKKKVGPQIDEDIDEEDEAEPESEDEEIGHPDDKMETKMEVEPDKESEATEEDVKTEEGEEEESIELTEQEEMIVNSLKNTDSLDSEILDTVVPDWWKKEPFRSTGFILEGFPRTADEVRYLEEKRLFPDAVILLNIAEDNMIGRLVPPRLTKWCQKRAKLLAKRARKKKKAMKKRQETIQKRREQLMKERAERRAERAAERRAAEAEDSGDEDEDVEEEGEEDDESEEDIEEILAEEFEEEGEHEEEEDETQEEFLDKLWEELSEVYADLSEKTDAVLDLLEEYRVPILDIDASRKPHIVRYLIKKRLKTYIDYRDSIFERVYTISDKIALKMIDAGYKQPSRFGRWCPVKLHEGDFMQPMNGPGIETFPCTYRQHIYYLSSSSAREAFIQDPMTYLRQPTPKPVVPIRLAIIGPPKSGKTTLATRFEEDYGVKKVSVGEAMRMVLETQSNTELAQLILGELRRGHVVPQELEVRALEVVVLDMRCQIRGYILDGYPMTLRQAELLDMHKIVPGRIINLELEDQTILSRGKQDRNSSTRAYPLHDSEAILRTKLEAFQANKESILQWYRTEHHNVTSLDSGQNKWWVWKHAVDVTRADVCQRQKYIERTEQGKAASMADMGLTRKEFLERLGDIGEYCPVSLSRGELVDGSRNPSLKFAAQFQGCHYKLAGQQELEEFLTEPSKFLPPLARFRLPSPNLLPVRHKKDEVQEITEVEMKGYCPVTFLDGLCRYEALVLGDPELIVEYRKKFYYMETEEKLLKFMRIPETYWNLVLPHKVPPRKDPVPITSLPNLGYLEQGVATALIAALTAAGNFKPKYPFVSATRSALLYIAYHLKAFNPKSSDYLRKKYKQKLRNFEESCNIIQYLGNAMTSRYREPSEWSAEFASKLEIFFALKGIEPTGNWIL